ncbi:hypothetical protein LJC05_00965, partial [Bacteroides sp. OttesenSCG-928-J23]|nr:hypothetical protein [Bacteroides sp. OttesenSCG-928-J23]
MNKIVEIVLRYQRVKVIVLLLGLLLVSGRVMGQVPFKEDFGGTAANPAWLLPTGGTLTLDNWKTTHPGIGSSLGYAAVTEGVTSSVYNLSTLVVNNGSYAVTKIKYNDENEYTGGNKTNIDAGAGDHQDRIVDHITEDGYFLVVNPSALSVGTTIYEKTLTVTPGESLSFSTWLMNMRKWGGAKTCLILKVTDGTNVVASKSIEVPSSSDWSSYGLTFIVPNDKSSIVVSVILDQQYDGANQSNPAGWLHAFALDDITVDYGTVTTTEPASGSNHCKWSWPVFKGNY